MYRISGIIRGLTAWTYGLPVLLSPADISSSPCRYLHGLLNFKHLTWL